MRLGLRNARQLGELCFLNFSLFPLVVTGLLCFIIVSWQLSDSNFPIKLLDRNEFYSFSHTSEQNGVGS